MIVMWSQFRRFATNKESLFQIVPQKVYNNAELLKKLIMKENKNKSGIYRWINNQNNKTYIGSSVNLSKRIGSYFSARELTKFVRPIHLALTKYGHSNFTLEILEYCSKDNLIDREQFYLDKFMPEYNVLTTAYSLQGYKHTQKTLDKLKERIVSKHTRSLLSAIHKEKFVSEETRKKLSIVTKNYKKLNPLSNEALKNLRDISIIREGVAVTVIDITTNERKDFVTQTEAALFLNVTRSAVYNAIKRNGVINNKYKVIKCI